MHVPGPELSALFQELDTSSHVVEGAVQNPKKTIYLFVDANCPFRHYTWKALQPYEKAGLQVSWILVATLGPTSMPKAIEVMTAQDQPAAFRKMEVDSGMPRLSELPGITGLPEQKIGDPALAKFR